MSCYSNIGSIKLNHTPLCPQQAKEYADAIRCYDAALSLTEPGFTVPVLLNLSAAHLNLGKHRLALLSAVTAASLSRGLLGGSSSAASVAPPPEVRHSKVFYRIALALDALGAHLAAHVAMRRAVSLPGGGPELYNHIAPLPGSGSGGGKPAPISSEAADKGWCQAISALAEAVAAEHHGIYSESGSGSERLEASTALADMCAAKVARQEGNVFFKAGEFSAAASRYCIALHLSGCDLEAAATLLSNRAACLLRIDHADASMARGFGNEARLQFSAFDSVAALMMRPRDHQQPSIMRKSYHRLVTVLLQLGFLPAAKAVCDLALSAFPADEDLYALCLRVETASSLDETLSDRGRGVTGGREDASRKPSGGKSLRASGSGSKQNEREMSKKDQVCSPEQTAMMNAMASMMTAERGRFTNPSIPDPSIPESILKLDDRVSPFHEDFAKHGR